MISFIENGVTCPDCGGHLEYHSEEDKYFCYGICQKQFKSSEVEENYA